MGDERVKRIAEETPAKISAIAACDNVPRNKEEYIPVYVSCESEEASEVLCQKDGIQGIYLPYALMEKHLQTGLDNGKEMYLSLPHITRENPPEGYMEQVKKWLEAGHERISCAESGVLQCTGTDGTGRQVCAGSLPVYLE